MKKLFDKVKAFIDVWKMWLFFGALLAGTNGAQMYVNSEPVIEPVKEVKAIIVKPIGKTIVIHKTDIEQVKKLITEKLNEHKNGSQH